MGATLLLYVSGRSVRLPYKYNIRYTYNAIEKCYTYPHDCTLMPELWFATEPNYKKKKP